MMHTDMTESRMHSDPQTHHVIQNMGNSPLLCVTGVSLPELLYSSLEEVNFRLVVLTLGLEAANLRKKRYSYVTSPGCHLLGGGGSFPPKQSSFPSKEINYIIGRNIV